MMEQAAKARACDQGERAFQEGQALVECLREACGNQSNFSPAGIVVVLEMVRERLALARHAFDHLAGA